MAATGLLLLTPVLLSLLVSSQPLLLPGSDLRRPAAGGDCPLPIPSVNNRPVVGILSHPGDGASGRLNNASGVSYIAASYVKFIESAGARVVPIVYNEPWEIIDEKLNLVNGMVFTGGWAKKGKYFGTVKRVFERVLEKNDAGEYFPLFAVCLGFELLSMIVSKDPNILESFSASYQASTLQFTTTELQGTVFQSFPPELLGKMSKSCLVMQNHKYGVSPERMMKDDALSQFFKVLTTSIDANNRVYVSTVQAFNYPVTGFQWHPEKNAFEWGYSMIPHTEDAIQVTQFTTNFFISETRKSSVRAPINTLLKMLIYNYPPIYSGSYGSGYDEVYIFG